MDKEFKRTKAVIISLVSVAHIYVGNVLKPSNKVSHVMIIWQNNVEVFSIEMLISDSVYALNFICKISLSLTVTIL